jgi:predicted nicotinamide N-methyase
MNSPARNLSTVRRTTSVNGPRPPARFFDNFPRFYETGNTGAGVRLNARYDCLIARHAEHLRNRNVLDVGSHNGRWSFAALRAGARHVIGVEPRPALVDASQRVFQEYGVTKDRFEFHIADSLEFLKSAKPKVDVILLFGVLYHVHYHVTLLQELRQTGAQILIIDTAIIPDRAIVPGEETILRLIAEPVDDISNGVGEIVPGASKVVVGVPSRGAVTFLLEMLGFEVSEISWVPYLRRWGADELKDYAQGERATFLACRRAT